MQTMSSKLMELVNKTNKLMSVDMIRMSVWKVFDREIEGLSLILMIKYALIYATSRGYRGAVIIAAVILGLSFIPRLIAAISGVPASIRLYKDLEEGYAECLAEEAAKKNQE